MTNFINAFKNEILKSKRTFAFWVSFAGSATIVGLFFLIYLIRWDKFLPEEGVNPWIEYIGNNISGVASILLPMYVVLIVSLIIFTEHKPTSWKQIFLQPVSFANFHFAKLSFILFLILATHIYFVITLIAAGYLLGLIHSELQFLNYTPDYFQLVKLVAKIYLSSLGITGIQYWLSLRFKNMFIPLGLGIAFIVAGTILISGWEGIVYYPYTFSLLIIALGPEAPYDKLFGYYVFYFMSPLYFLITAIGSYFDFKRIDVK